MKNFFNFKAQEAFTRTELCVVVGTVGVMALLVLPTLAREQNHDWRAVCLNHLSRLANAMAVYALDNQDYLPPNPGDGNSTPGCNWCPGVAGVGGVDEFNADILKDKSRSLLAPYLNYDVSIFKCPGDTRTGKYNGSVDVVPEKAGTIVPAARTVSLSQAVGTLPSPMNGTWTVDGPWLDGRHGHTSGKTFYTYGSLSSFIKPGPAKTFTFIEEDPRSLNDGGFACMGPTDGQTYNMIDWPSTFHGMAGGVAFADSHVEMHRWVDPRTRLSFGQDASISTQSGNPDLEWLANHVSAKIAP